MLVVYTKIMALPFVIALIAAVKVSPNQNGRTKDYIKRYKNRLKVI